jgi:hypothetical protein
MWPKLLILTVAAAFLAVAGTGVMAHDGRISNIIEDPGEADEHPWGGGNEYTDGPSLVSTQIDGPSFLNGRYFFLGVTIKHSWTGIRHFIWDRIPEDTKSDTQTTPIPANNNNDTTGQGTGN